MKSKCNPASIQFGCYLLALASFFVVSATGYAQEQVEAVSGESAASPSQNSKPKKPVIRQYPNTPVWSDAKIAATEFPGFAFVGEYVIKAKAMQVTPAEGKFYLSIYEGGLPGAGWDGKAVAHEWVEADAINTRLSGWKKIDRSKSVTGKPAPQGAIVLFDGTDAKEWNNGKVENGYLKAGTRTKRRFKDFRLYLEFLVPLKPEPPISHPHRGNSGVFAVGAYEVQIADTFGLDSHPLAWKQVDKLKPVNTWCGSIYGIRAADTNTCLPPLSWQSMEIDFRAARFDGKKKITPAVVSVIQNGVKIHDKVVLPEGTGGGPAGPQKEVAEGPIYLQNHGNPNLFRNIWIEQK